MLAAVEEVDLAVREQRPVERARPYAVGARPGVELIAVVPPDELVRPGPATQDVLAAVRDDIARFVDTLFFVYTLLIIAYILSSLYFAFGGRMPYSRWSSAVLGFLRDVCEPYLSIFRRFIPPLGPLDLSPVIAIFLLQLVGRLVANLIAG